MIGFASVFSKLKGWMLGALGVAVLVIGLFRTGRKVEKAEQQAKSMKETVHNIEVKREVDNDIDRLPDADIDKRMQQRGDFRD
jgi:hypothetical protein